MNKSFKLIGGALALVLSTTSCVDDGFFRSDWDTPSIACNAKFGDANISLADFVALTPTSGTLTITEDYIFEGYVISSDETGNFTGANKVLVIQDSPINPTKGLAISIAKNNTYADYPVGTKISINAKGLALALNNRLPTLGAVPTSTYVVDRISDAQLGNHIAKSCVNGTFVKEEITPLEVASLNDITEQHLNLLVKVSNVQFKDADGTLTYVENQAHTNRTLINIDKQEVTLRTLSSASFGSQVLPTGSGDITFVVSRYNANFQMFIRSTADVNFTNERFGETTQEPTTPETPAEGTRPNTSKGGTNITYLGAGTSIDFESYATGANSEAFPEFYNDAMIGSWYWRVASFSNNKYIQLSFGNNSANSSETKTYFVVPVDFDNMSAFSFKSKDGYNSGNVLKVYYSTDYTPTNANPTLEDITSSFAISNAGTPNGFPTDFTESGDWAKPSTLTGKGFIIFEYYGGAGANLPTTRMQIDDITIK